MTIESLRARSFTRNLVLRRAFSCSGRGNESTAHWRHHQFNRLGIARRLRSESPQSRRGWRTRYLVHYVFAFFALRASAFAWTTPDLLSESPRSGRGGRTHYFVHYVFAFFAIGASAFAQEPLSKPAKSKRNSLGQAFVLIPAGEYRRGFDGSDGRENRFHTTHEYSNRQIFKHEGPSHKVILTKPFEIATTEVTVGQFQRFVAATGYVTDAEKNEGALGFFPNEKDYVDRFQKSAKVTWKTPGFEQTDEHPVVCVSWNDAQAFCDWLSKTENARYRLPTEAEWEYACRAAQPTWYSWGESPDDSYQHANVADGALEAAYAKTTSYQRAVRLQADDGDGAIFTAPVGSYRANPWGLHDMHGNVWEWCEDRWKADLYRSYFVGVDWPDRKNLTRTNPVFLQETDQHKYGDWRSMRGGAWTCAPAATRSSIRTFAEAADASVYTGFRIVRDVQ